MRARIEKKLKSIIPSEDYVIFNSMRSWNDHKYFLFSFFCVISNKHLTVYYTTL